MNLFATFYVECRVCGLLFKSYRSLNKHLAELHPKIKEDAN